MDFDYDAFSDIERLSLYPHILRHVIYFGYFTFVCGACACVGACVGLSSDGLGLGYVLTELTN